MSDQKPREFWIAEHGMSDMYLCSSVPIETDLQKRFGQATHVIEYQAYAELSEKLKLAVECLELIKRVGCHNCSDIPDRALAQIEDKE